MTPKQARKLKPGDIVHETGNPSPYFIVMSNNAKDKVIQFIDKGCLEWREMGGYVHAPRRDYLTEEEHEVLVQAGNVFAQKLAAITAQQLKKFDIGVRDQVLAHLQDRTSLYSPIVADRIYQLLGEQRDF